MASGRKTDFNVVTFNLTRCSRVLNLREFVRRLLRRCAGAFARLGSG